VADGGMQALMVEPGDPFQRFQFEGFAGFPGRTAADEFGLVQPIDGLGHGIIVAVAAAADRGLDARFGQALAVAD